MPKATIGISPNTKGCFDNGNNKFTFTDTVIWATSAAASSAYEWDFYIDRGSNNSSANPTTSVNGSPAAVTYNSKGDKKIQFILKIIMGVRILFIPRLRF